VDTGLGVAEFTADRPSAFFSTLMAPACTATTANSHTMMVRQHRSSESSLPPAVSHRQVGHILQHNGKKAERWGRLQLAIGHDKFGLNRQNNSSKAEHVNSLQTAVDRLSNGIPPLSTGNSNLYGAQKAAYVFNRKQIYRLASGETNSKQSTQRLSRLLLGCRAQATANTTLFTAI
jgi:hypothetical protein